MATNQIVHAGENIGRIAFIIVHIDRRQDLQEMGVGEQYNNRNLNYYYVVRIRFTTPEASSRR